MRRFFIVKPDILRYNCVVRIDLFLKTSRLVKRRAVAREMCEAARVLVNGSAAKPSREVKLGDVITLNYAHRVLDVEVLIVPTSKNARAEGMFRVVADKRAARPDHDEAL